MKTLAALYFGITKDRKSKRDLASLFKFLVALVALVTMHSILFHLIMSYEGQSHRAPHCRRVARRSAPRHTFLHTVRIPR